MLNGTSGKGILLTGLSLAVLMYSCKTRSFEPSTQRGSSFLKAVSGLENVPTLDVNDVSVLYPPNAFTPLSAVMTQQDFQDVINFGEGKGPAGIEIGFSADAKAIENWKVVSFRYDPCAPGAHAASTIATELGLPGKDTVCRGQLRLIAQPFAADGIVEEDVTFHLLYGLSREDADIRRQLEGIAAIKLASQGAGAPTDGVPLSVHPGLKSQEVIRARDKFIQDFAPQSGLQSVAAMALTGGGPEPWVFYASVRNPATNRLVHTPIPTVGNNFDTPFQALSFIGDERVIGTPSLLSTFKFPGAPPAQNFNRQSIAPRSTQAIFKATGFSDEDIVEMKPDLLSILHGIDNPDKNHFFTMDCVSCHSTTNLLLRRFGSASDSEKNIIRTVSPERFFVPQGITAYVNLKDAPTDATFGRPWTVRNFGYFNGNPRIAHRTVTETAEVIADINDDIMSRKIDSRKQFGPNVQANGLSPEAYKVAEPKIWACMNFSNDTYEKCFAQATQTGSGNQGNNGTAGQNCTALPPPSALQALRQSGRIFTLVHGSGRNSSRFAANAQVNEPSNFPALSKPLGGSLQFKFFLRHSATDSSNLGLRMKTQDGKELEGIRYNMSFGAQGAQVSMALKWNCDKWEGTLGTDTVSAFRAP